MLRRRPSLVHPPGILERLSGRIRGREQMLVRGDPDWPLLLLSYPRGALDEAKEVEAAYTHTFPLLTQETRSPYEALLPALPAIVVVLLRRRNPCGCLGHYHPRGTESRLTRRLASDLGSATGEIDIAYEGIREWQPQPLSSMALGDMGGRLASLHVRAATVAVLMHELEHLAFPDAPERETRGRSNALYSAVMSELVAAESDSGYGMASSPPRP